MILPQQFHRFNSGTKQGESWKDYEELSVLLETGLVYAEEQTGLDPAQRVPHRHGLPQSS